MTEEQKEDIKLLKELIADTSIPNDDREIYQEALNQILAETKSDMPKSEEAKSDMPKVEKVKMPKKEKVSRKTKATPKTKAEKPTALPSDVEEMKKAIKERTGKTEAECEDIIAQYRKLRAKAKVNSAKRTQKLKSDDKLITGTNVITPVAQIEKDAEIVKEKIEKQVEQIENKAEREVVKKDKTKDEVKVEVDKKVVKQLSKLSDEMVTSATTFVKNIQTELKKVDKTEAKNFLLGLRNEIDALLSKFGDGGSTIETYNITENESASSVNPTLFARGGGVDSNKIKEHVLECKKLVSAFCKEYGQRFSLNEKEILSKVSKNITDNGADIFIAFDVNSNIKSLKIDEVKPRTAYVVLSSQINPNGVSETIGIKRTYTINFKVKGDKRYTQRRTEEGYYFKSYNYGLTIDEVMDKFDTDVIYELFPLEQKDNFKLTMSNVFANGGSVDDGDFARGGGVGSSDKLYIFKVYNLNDKLVDKSRRIFARNLSEAKEIAILIEDEMHLKYGRDLRFKIEEAPLMMAKGGGVGNPSKKEMLDYLNMYFDYYSELRTIAIEEDNILTRRMLNSLDNEELQMAYDDAKYEMKAETQFAKGGGVRIGKDGREYPFGSAWALEHNKNNKNEKYEIPTSSRKS
jgi:hypothetical protein